MVCQQCCVKAGHRTEDILLIMNTMLDSCVIHRNTPLYVGVCRLLSKFFDEINKTHFFDKLLKRCITECAFDMIKSLQEYWPQSPCKRLLISKIHGQSRCKTALFFKPDAL